MKSNTINLPKDTYISDIEPFKSKGIPTNSIVHKEITGCGITTFEIRFAKHHSIIILPNVPVIKGKVAEHNKRYPDDKIIGVHKGIDIEDVEEYIDSDVQYKKILTTPEGFINKVMPALDSIWLTVQESWFLLYDECERIITDVSYRGKIAAPLEVFFEFKNKALVSATTLNYSDPRFKDFERYDIVPDYDFSQPLKVISTNNVIAAVKSILDELQSEHVCIFFNSTKGIYALTKTLDIVKQSKAFCSYDSAKKLWLRGLSNATDEFTVEDMPKYSLFTSRYFSAVDINLDYNPDVIMISDVFFADHSILDPRTEVIQIAGRFRNGLNSLTHITNFNPNIEYRNEADELVYLNGCLDTYEHIVHLLRNADHPGVQETLKFFVEKSPIAGFYTNGIRNHFMIDNDLNAERVKCYYQQQQNLKSAYDGVSKHFIAVYLDENYPIADEDLFQLAAKTTKREKHAQVAILLEKYSSKVGSSYKFLSEAARKHKDELIFKYPLIAKAHNLLGLQKLQETGFKNKEIQKAVRAATKYNEIARLKPFVQAVFEEHTVYEDTKVKALIESAYTKAGSNFNSTSAHILRYFDGQRTTRNAVNVYVLKNKRDEVKSK